MQALSNPNASQGYNPPAPTQEPLPLEPARPPSPPEPPPPPSPTNPHFSANPAAFQEYGFAETQRVQETCAMRHVSPEYIRAQALRLDHELRIRPWLLMTAVRKGEPRARDKVNISIVGDRFTV